MIFSDKERFFLRHNLTLRTPYDHGAALKLVSDNPAELDVQDVVNRAIAAATAAGSQQETEGQCKSRQAQG